MSKHFYADVSDIFTPEVIADMKPSLICELLQGVEPMQDPTSFKTVYDTKERNENDHDLGTST